MQNVEEVEVIVIAAWRHEIQKESRPQTFVFRYDAYDIRSLLICSPLH